MKSKDDLVRGRLRKAESDLAGAGLCLSAGKALDTACFHDQQALDAATRIRDFVLDRLPATMNPTEP